MDDGSNDGTHELVEEWCNENLIPIRYFWQENQGKHVAVNYAVQQSKAFAFASIDSDDALLPSALKTLYDEWMKIENKEEFKGVTGRCIDPDTRAVLGSKLPKSPFDVHTMDMRLKYKIKGEMWGFNRVDILKKYPFPTPDPRMRFCPENIVWYEIGKKYKERIVDVPVREYYKDTSNAITGKSTNRSIANYYGWQYGANNILPYIWYSPKEVIKNYVGLSMDGKRTGRGLTEILSGVNGFMPKLMTLLFYPIGYALGCR